MGTAFTIDIRDPGDWADAIGAVVAWLHFVDATFSTFRPDSAINRIRRRELRVEDAQPEVRHVLDRCTEAQRATGGYFTPHLCGQLDPTGLVKGWAVERASDLLRDLGSANHAINGGGDMQLAGEAAPGQPWTIGISDPTDRSRLLTTIVGRDLAVATSGVGERGQHIVDPFTGRAATGLAAVTVVGARLTDVDSFATAAFAMGQRALPWLESMPGHEGMLVTDDATMQCTSRWRQIGAGPGSRSSQVPAGTAAAALRPEVNSSASSSMSPKRSIITSRT